LKSVAAGSAGAGEAALAAADLDPAVDGAVADPTVKVQGAALAAVKAGGPKEHGYKPHRATCWDKSHNRSKVEVAANGGRVVANAVGLAEEGVVAEGVAWGASASRRRQL
jgi:hypothetical protein